MHMIACILLPLSQTDLWTPVCRFITVVVNSKLAKATDFEFLTRLVYTATSYARVNCSSQKKKKKRLAVHNLLILFGPHKCQFLIHFSKGLRNEWRVDYHANI